MDIMLAFTSALKSGLEAGGLVPLIVAALSAIEFVVKMAQKVNVGQEMQGITGLDRDVFSAFWRFHPQPYLWP
jgi:hypothetical protein